MKKLYAVTDLGPGDGGKGGVVHKITHMMNAHTVLKVGGAQGSHGVATSGGDRFAFSQFGCGTFEGVRTHLTQRFVASPEGILNEAAALRNGHGIHDIFDFLTVDEEVVCASPYHGIASRLKELSRKDNPRGTIGTGVGEAYRDAEKYPDLVIRARDLACSNLRDRIVAVREQVTKNLALIIDAGFLPEDRLEAEREIALLSNQEFLEHVVQRFREVSRLVKIVGREHLCSILARDGVVVAESSHGVLTDRYYGFHPHTSALRTLPRFVRAMVEEAGYGGQFIQLGITRAYQIRHGAGPMPTADEAMAENLLPGSHKEENRYQGRVRVGPLDLVLLRYAIAASGGPGVFDGLAITWFDQIEKNGSWRICRRYANADDPIFFSLSGAIKVGSGEDEVRLAHQEALGKKLRECIPELTEVRLASGMEREELYNLCAGVLDVELGSRVRMVSLGPTERDKLCK